MHRILCVNYPVWAQIKKNMRPEQIKIHYWQLPPIFSKLVQFLLFPHRIPQIKLNSSKVIPYNINSLELLMDVQSRRKKTASAAAWLIMKMLPFFWYSLIYIFSARDRDQWAKNEKKKHWLKLTEYPVKIECAAKEGVRWAWMGRWKVCGFSRWTVCSHPRNFDQFFIMIIGTECRIYKNNPNQWVIFIDTFDVQKACVPCGFIFPKGLTAYSNSDGIVWE